ncbi:MAG: HD-GYP domain-containing protein [Ectothiorhodospiraceae bacterium]|nr:HD-GYP domain-containing protein [Ectothiorhodospiraceae bacterium]
MADLRIGMYVASLDRPWLETPFLFQGFKISSEEELQQVRDICRYVFVDAELSSVPVPVGKAAQSYVHPSPVRDLAEFRSAIDRAAQVRARSRDYLKNVFSDVRLGRSVDTDEARDVVSGLVESISADANAAIWLTQLKNKDEYTSLHCLNVCVLTLAFCRHLGYGEQDLQAIGLGALLHDIGKTRTPLEILNKPGRLTPDEFKIMQRHPEDGYRIMKAAGSVPEESLHIIRHHHERVSGDGYPSRLPEYELNDPLMAASIADVYDAISSDRVYHKALPTDVALRVMYEDAEHTFGKRLMEEFIRCVGIYPVGSLVELGSGALGVVVDAGTDTRLLPKIMLVRDYDGAVRETAAMVDLAARSRGGSAEDWTIRRVVSPSDVGLNPHKLLLGASPVEAIIP